MFGFRKKKSAPPLCQANPGNSTEGKVAFSNGERSWTEKFNLVTLAAAVLKERGYPVIQEKTWLKHPDSGFLLLPRLVGGVQPREDGGVQTTTTMQIHHPQLAPDGVFEYQHSIGKSSADSFSKGFDQWVQTDFVTLLGALQPQPASCMAMEFQFPATEGKSPRVRRAVLGPVAHFQEKPPVQAKKNGEEEHPFCSCCLLTHTFQAFQEFIEGDGFYCLRLYAALEPDGTPQADCRVNGEDWEKGAEALREYARTWPEAGYEFRKQYVVLQSIEESAKRVGN